MIFCKECNTFYSNESNWKRHKTMGNCKMKLKTNKIDLSDISCCDDSQRLLLNSSSKIKIEDKPTNLSISFQNNFISNNHPVEIDYDSDNISQNPTQNFDEIVLSDDSIVDDSQVENNISDLTPLDLNSKQSLLPGEFVSSDAHERFIFALRKKVQVHDMSICAAREFEYLSFHYPNHHDGWLRCKNRFMSISDINHYHGNRYKASLESKFLLLSIHLTHKVHWALVIRETKNNSVFCYYIDSKNDNSNLCFVQSRLRGTPILPRQYQNNWKMIKVPY